MCTVSLTSVQGREEEFILTSNRDEAVNRNTFPPQEYFYKNVKMIFPKDETAGGTWIGISNNNRVLCLLNGGFEKHVRQPNYRKSRGIVVLDFLACRNFQEELEHYNLANIEPFTLVVVDWNKKMQFLELVWDGKEKHLRNIPRGNHIWSSSLLYSPRVRREREVAFHELAKNKPLTAENLWQFHIFPNAAGEDGFIIDRGFLKTVSITQVSKIQDNQTMKYRNLLEKENPIIENKF